LLNHPKYIQSLGHLEQASQDSVLIFRFNSRFVFFFDGVFFGGFFGRAPFDGDFFIAAPLTEP